MNRSKWLNGPFWGLKFWVRWTLVFYWVAALICVVSVIAHGDLWLLAAMAPGVFMTAAHSLLQHPGAKMEEQNGAS
jgi:hypothetical protein